MNGTITERYTATVTSTEDEENRGRIKVACAQLLGDEDSELPDFIEPSLDWGWFVVPDVGEQVEIEVVTGTETDESPGQGLLEGGTDNVRWRMVRPYTDEELDGESTNIPAPIHPEFVAENYGKRRGFATPAGHILLFDDTEGATKIFLTWVKELSEPDQALKTDPANITQVLIDVDGSFKVTTLEKTFLHLKPVDDGNGLEISLNEANDVLKLDGDGKAFEVSLDGGSHIVKLDAGGTKLELTIDSGAGMTITGKDADTVTELGVADVSAAIADHLETLWGKLNTWLDAHVHGTGVGPSSPPTTGPSEVWDGSINSNKLKFPDGAD